MIVIEAQCDQCGKRATAPGAAAHPFDWIEITQHRHHADKAVHVWLCSWGCGYAYTYRQAGRRAAERLQKEDPA